MATDFKRAEVCLVALVYATLAVSTAQAGDKSVLLEPAGYLAHIQFLANDALGGRYPGKPGIEQAADYIAEHFKAAGLKPAGDDGTYFQTFPLRQIKTLDEHRASVAVSGMDRKWKLHEDFVPFPFSTTGKAKGPLAFAGYGIAAEDLGYDDYADFDATGKVLLIMRHEPRSDDPEAKLGGKSNSVHSLFVRKARVARDHGAVALLIVNPPGRYADDDPLYSWNPGESSGSYALPMIHITQKMANAILKHAHMPRLAVLEQELEASREPLSTDLAGMSVTLDTGLDPVKTRNVVAVLPGDGSTDEYIAIGAHYDHLGISRTRGSEAPQVHNGADDNASGTAGVLELARVLAAGPRLHRNVLFITFSAEEEGLVGSDYFVEHPTVPLDKIRAMVNFDMIGRLSQHKLEIWGLPTAKEFKEMVAAAAKREQLEYKAPEKTSGIFTRSDHYNFYRKGIPVMFPFTGLHKQYHRPSDDWELIDPAGAVRILRFAREIITELANMTDGPTLVTEEEAEAEQAAAANQPQAPPMRMPRVRMGVVPNMDGGSDGMLIDDVTPGQSAAKAGLKAGDRIIKIGPHDIHNLMDYMKAAANYKPGDTVHVVVVRDGKNVTLKLTFQGAPAAGGD